MYLHVLKSFEGSSLHLPSSSMKGVGWNCVKLSLTHLLFSLSFFSVRLLRTPFWPVKGGLGLIFNILTNIEILQDVR